MREKAKSWLFLVQMGVGSQRRWTRLSSITSGSIEVDGTGGLGLCPQKNVLWDELTVFKHVKIFDKMKLLVLLTRNSRFVNLSKLVTLNVSFTRSLRLFQEARNANCSLQ